MRKYSEEPQRDLPPEEGLSAAAGVDSNTVIPVISDCLGRRDSGEGVCLKVDTPLDSSHPHKLARLERSEAHFAASSTLEYDKRVADS